MPESLRRTAAQVEALAEAVDQVKLNTATIGDLWVAVNALRADLGALRDEVAAHQGDKKVHR